MTTTPSAGRGNGVRRVIPLVAALILLLGFAFTARGDHPFPRPHRRLAIAPAPPPRPCAVDPARRPVPRAPDGQPLDYWHTCGTQIVDRTGREVHIAGVAWSGMELAGGATQGLDRRDYGAILEDVKALGYNVVRVPFNSESIQAGSMPSGINYQANPDLRGLSSLEVLDRIVAECGRLGLKVILDHHRIDPWDVPALWYDQSYSQAQWIADWRRLAERYSGNDTVVGFDLQNEPYAATWGDGNPATDWRLAATLAGNAVLAVNPRLLLFVQGIGKHQGVDYWYGGELQDVARAPIHFAVPGRLVYSPHEYGPSVYPQGWFYAPDFPSNLPAIWDLHWAFIAERGLAPVVVGEMGAPQTGYGVGGTWQRTLLSFLERRDIGFIAWALNPDSSDTGSVFEGDWQTVNAARQALYAPYLSRGTGGELGSGG
ncbi:MAG TPA: glycoside hydrolase family 5 protein [Chloroflexota bacterium]|nr:glycoside hydrolase family 5 protein [Chloroflexota bacterium]